MTMKPKKFNPEEARRTVAVPRVHLDLNPTTWKKHINETFDLIVSFINQQKITNLPECNMYIKSPLVGDFVFASGWTEIVDPITHTTKSGSLVNEGFNPNYKFDHTQTTGNPGDGRGLWLYNGIKEGSSDTGWFEIKHVDMPK